MRIENWELSNWSYPPPDSVSGETGEFIFERALSAASPQPKLLGRDSTPPHGFAQRDGNGTQEAHRSHKKHKKTSFALLFCASCALNCAFCVPSPFRCAKP